jgi:hypothetical protein
MALGTRVATIVAAVIEVEQFRADAGIHWPVE